MALLQSNILQSGLLIEKTNFIGGYSSLAFTNTGKIFAINTAFTQSYQITSPTSNAYTSLSFPLESVGYALTIVGEIIKTTDQGRTWSIISTIPSCSTAYEIQALDINNLYVAGSRTSGTTHMATLWKSTDGGINWSISYSGTATIDNGYPLKAVSFLNSATGYCSSYFQIMKTVDSGNTWVKTTTYNGILPSPGGIFVNKYVNTLKMKDATSGYVGVDFVVGSPTGTWGLSGYNGSTGVINTDYGIPSDINSIFISSPNRIFAVGDSGVLAKSTNSGSTFSWQQLFVGFDNLTSIHFVQDGSRGFTVGQNGRAYYTNDSGDTWNLSTVFTTDHYNVCYRIK